MSSRSHALDALLRNASAAVRANLTGLAATLALCASCGPADRDSLPRADDVATFGSGAGLDVRGAVTIPPGEYTIDVQGGGAILRLSGPGVVLDLTGVTLRAAPSHGPGHAPRIAVDVIDAPNAVVRGGTIEGFDTAVRAARSPRAELDGVTIEFGSGSPGTSAINAAGSPGMIVRSCVIQGIALFSESPGVRVHDCSIRGDGDLGAIALESSPDSIVCRNRIRASVSDRAPSDLAPCALRISGPAAGTIVALNDVHGFGDGVRIDGTESLPAPADSRQAIVFRNRIDGASRHGIHATGATSFEATENRIVGASVGVVVNGGSGARVRANEFETCATGVRILNASHVSVDRNEFLRCSAAGVVWENSTAPANEREGAGQIGPFNAFEECATDLRLRDAARIRIVGNAFRGPRPAVKLDGDMSGARLIGNVLATAPLAIAADHTGVVFVAESDGVWREPRVKGDGVVKVDNRHLSHPGGSIDLPPPVDVSKLPGRSDPVRDAQPPR